MVLDMFWGGVAGELIALTVQTSFFILAMEQLFSAVSTGSFGRLYIVKCT
jgi:hypothetical protein